MSDSNKSSIHAEIDAIHNLKNNNTKRLKNI